MADTGQLEQRVSALEQDVAQLKSRLKVDESTNWVDQRSGTFEGDETFREILRLGQEDRKSQHDDSPM